MRELGEDLNPPKPRGANTAALLVGVGEDDLPDRSRWQLQGSEPSLPHGAVQHGASATTRTLSGGARGLRSCVEGAGKLCARYTNATTNVTFDAFDPCPSIN